jgi:hypothetical protein
MPFMHKLTGFPMVMDDRAPTAWTSGFKQNELGTRMAHLGISLKSCLNSRGRRDAGGCDTRKWVQGEIKSGLSLVSKKSTLGCRHFHPR